MVDRVRRLCRQDDAIVSALMYGSFARGEGDAYSDIEFVLYFSEEALATLDREAWVGQIAPMELFFADAFGHFTAIFSNLVRGEFHFEPCANMEQVRSWAGNAYFPRLEDCLIKDRDGTLATLLAPLAAQPARDVPKTAADLAANLANSVLFGHSVLSRGEYARALELLGLVHRYLLWPARLAERSIDHWPTPSRALEAELSPRSYERFRECTAALDGTALGRAYRASWEWGKELAGRLALPGASLIPPSLVEKIDERLAS